MKRILLVCAAVALLGAGCFSPAPGAEDKTTTPPSSTTQTPPKPSPTPGSTTTVTANVNASSTVTIDETWKTYTSKQGDFSFQWPTKGRNVPEWAVTFSNSDCAGTGASPEGEPSHVTLNGTPFCHAAFTEGAAGNFYFTDAYTTKVGSRYVVITFTKHVYSAGALNCSFIQAHPYSTSASSCVAFEEDAYHALLDQIVATFTLTAN